MSEPVLVPSTPTAGWYLGIEVGRNEAGANLVCPECGEYIAGGSPVSWRYESGPVPGFSHLIDGEALCPVVGTLDGVSSYVPATPVTRREYDDANGCPCDTGAFGCSCSCTACLCRIAGFPPVDPDEQVLADDANTLGGVIPRG
jgi:hypothetical protein